VLTEAAKSGGNFNQGSDMPHDDFSLMAVFDIAVATHGIDFIKQILDELCSPEYKLIERDEQGFMLIRNWEKYQHHTLSTERVQKHREGKQYDPMIDEVLMTFNKLTGKKLNIKTDAYRKLIRGRLTDGYSVEDLKRVIIWKIQQWGSDKKMAQYIRPDTLFRPSHFDIYLNEIPKNNRPTSLDVAAQSEAGAPEVFAVTDIYGRNRVVTQAEFDKAESGFLTKV